MEQLQNHLWVIKVFLLYEKMHKYLTLYKESVSEENLIFFFISVGWPGENSWHGIYSLFRLFLQEAGGAHPVRRELVSQKHVCKQKKSDFVIVYSTVLTWSALIWRILSVLLITIL